MLSDNIYLLPVGGAVVFLCSCCQVELLIEFSLCTLENNVYSNKDFIIFYSLVTKIPQAPCEAFSDLFTFFQLSLKPLLQWLWSAHAHNLYNNQEHLHSPFKNIIKENKCQNQGHKKPI